MNELAPSIPDLIENQLPESVRSPENRRFVSLLKHYYDWLVQAGQPTEFVNNLLQYRDLDLTNDAFRDHLTRSLVDMLPVNPVADRTLIAKNIGEFLKLKGSYDSFQIVMMAIYGEDIDMEWNSTKLMRPSSNEYSRTASLAIESSSIWQDVSGSEINQISPSPASAIISSSVSTTFGGTHINWITLNDKSVVGSFTPNGTVEILHSTADRSKFRIQEYYNPTSYTNHTLEFLAVTEQSRPYENLIVRQLNSTFRGVVSTFVSRQQQTNNTRVVLILKSETGTFVTGNEVYIFPSVLEAKLITKSDYETGIVSSAIVDVDINEAGSSYTSGDVVKFVGGSGELAEGYVAEVTSGGIDTIDIANKGYGYAVGDLLRVIDADTSGKGAVAVVAAVDGIDGAIDVVSELNTLSIVDSGSGYAANDEVELVGGTLVAGSPPARIKVNTVLSAWLFKGIRIDTAGHEYPRYSKVALINTTNNTKVSGFVATPIFNLGSGISNIIISDTPTISTGSLVVSINGYGATATATLFGGAVTAIPMVTVGTNYIDPVVTVIGNGTGAIATAVMTGDTVTSVVMVKGGVGYTAASVVISERLGSGFSATPLIQNQTALTGSIATYTILERGKYTTLPKCFDLMPVSKIGVGYGAKISLDFRLATSTIVNNGHYYHAISNSITGKGTGAALFPQIHDGVVSSINKVSGGSGYTFAYVLIDGGIGFVGRASILAGAVDLISIIQGGYNFSSANLVTIIGDGINASFNLLGVGNITNGVLFNVTVLNGGRDYFYGTTVTCPTSQAGAIAATLTPVILNGSIASVTTNGGSGYITSDLANLAISTGTSATITTTISGNGGIVGYKTVDSGSGYKSQAEVTPISITTAGAGTGAVFLPSLDSSGRILRVDILDGGSNYTSLSTIVVSGGGGLGAVLTPVVYMGRITDVVIVDAGNGYEYGTYALVIGDGINGSVTPVVETGITSVEIINGGEYVRGDTTIAITDSTGTGAEIRPTIVDGVITALTITKKGIGYTNPTIEVSGGAVGINTSLTATAKRMITSLTITAGSSGYTYADVIIVGDGDKAEFDLSFEKLGSIDATAITVAGAGYVSTPTVIITDSSAYGAVSKVRIVNNGTGYRKTPILTLDNKYNSNGAITATGTKFVAYGAKIGGVRKVMLKHHGAFYHDSPVPIFNIKATISENAAFRLGEEVKIVGGKYKDTNPINYTLLEDGSRLVMENFDPLLLDRDISFFDIGAIAKVTHFDFDRNMIELEATSDTFNLITENSFIIQSEDEVDVINQSSNSFDVGDTIVGTNSGAHATIRILNRANGLAVKGGNGWSEFKFKDETGKLNSKLSVLADNQKYQDYAYVIKAGRSLKDYEKMIKDTVHPAGFALFGEVLTQTEVDMNILNEIGYNYIVAIVYLVSISSDFQAGSEWTQLSNIFSDLAKFEFDYMPISLVQDYSIHATSDIVFNTYAEYNAAPIVSLDLLDWSVVNGCQITKQIGTAPDGSYTLSNIKDTSAITTSGLLRSVPCAVGNTITIELFVKKQVGPLAYSRITLDSNYINFNSETGAYTSSINTVLDMIDLDKYWFIRIKAVATGITMLAQIYPAAGLSTVLGVPDNSAIGDISTTNIEIKNISGLVSHTGILRAVNTDYVPTKLYLLDTESQINIQ